MTSTLRIAFSLGAAVFALFPAASASADFHFISVTPYYNDYVLPPTWDARADLPHACLNMLIHDTPSTATFRITVDWGDGNQDVLSGGAIVGKGSGYAAPAADPCHEYAPKTTSYLVTVVAEDILGETDSQQLSMTWIGAWP